MLPSFMNKPFTRKRYPTITDHGSSVRDFTATPAEATVYGSIQPAAGGVDQVNRNGAEVSKTIWARPDADVTHYDIFALSDGNYFVNGEPERWETGILDHVVISLSRWTG